MKIIHIWWDKVDYNNTGNLDEKKHKGVYQVYADHPVYGNNSLIYIGKTYKQTFHSRLNQHGDFVNSNFQNFVLYIGMFVQNEYVTNNHQEAIDYAEKLLINSHYPAYNANEIKNLLIFDEKRDIHILNWNNYGSLLPEVSSQRFTDKYWNDKMMLINSNEELIG